VNVLPPVTVTVFTVSPEPPPPAPFDELWTVPPPPPPSTVMTTCVAPVGTVSVAEDPVVKTWVVETKQAPTVSDAVAAADVPKAFVAV